MNANNSSAYVVQNDMQTLANKKFSNIVLANPSPRLHAKTNLQQRSNLPVDPYNIRKYIREMERLLCKQFDSKE